MIECRCGCNQFGGSQTMLVCGCRAHYVVGDDTAVDCLTNYAKSTCLDQP